MSWPRPLQGIEAIRWESPCLPLKPLIRSVPPPHFFLWSLQPKKGLLSKSNWKCFPKCVLWDLSPLSYLQKVLEMSHIIPTASEATNILKVLRGHKETVCNAGDPGSISGSRRSPGEGKCNSLQYSCLENSMGRGAWQANSSWDHKESDMTERLTLWEVVKWRQTYLTTMFFFHVNLLKIISWNSPRNVAPEHTVSKN